MLLFGDWFINRGFRNEDIVRLEWPEDGAPNRSIVLVLNVKHYAKDQREMARVEVPPWTTITPALLEIAYLKGKVQKPCSKCHGEGEYEVAVPGGRWDAAMGNFQPAQQVELCVECDHGWLEVTPEDIANRAAEEPPQEDGK